MKRLTLAALYLTGHTLGRLLTAAFPSKVPGVLPWPDDDDATRRWVDGEDW